LSWCSCLTGVINRLVSHSLKKSKSARSVSSTAEGAPGGGPALTGSSSWTGAGAVSSDTGSASASGVGSTTGTGAGAVSYSTGSASGVGSGVGAGAGVGVGAGVGAEVGSSAEMSGAPESRSIETGSRMKSQLPPMQTSSISK
jgi:hypothetical protein